MVILLMLLCNFKNYNKTKDTAMKLIGIVTTFIYIIEGASYTGKSIDRGPIENIDTLTGGACFSKNTKIKLNDGKIKKNERYCFR